MSLKKNYISNKFSNKFSKHSIFCHTVTFIIKPYIFNETPSCIHHFVNRQTKTSYKIIETATDNISFSMIMSLTERVTN